MLAFLAVVAQKSRPLSRKQPDQKQIFHDPERYVCWDQYFPIVGSLVVAAVGLAEAKLQARQI